MSQKVKHCTACGKAFQCGRDEAGHVCWCETLPKIKQIEEGGDCLCAACLKKSIQSDIREFVQEVKSGEKENIAPQYLGNGMPFVEGIDYYLENNLWVFTEWYHLKRGYCCGSGCRHCPYPKRTPAR